MLDKAGKLMFGFLKKRGGGQPPLFCSAVVPAAGSSRRMGGENKLFAQVGGLSVLARTVMALAGSELIGEIIVATREEDLMTAADLCRACGIEKPLKLVVGDEELIKLHYHTNEPWQVLEYCASLGDIHDIVVENMQRQADGLMG